MFIPSPLVGEGGSPRRGETGERSLSARTSPALSSPIKTPHPALRATFSHKGRRKKNRAKSDNPPQRPQPPLLHRRRSRLRFPDPEPALWRVLDSLCTDASTRR